MFFCKLLFFTGCILFGIIELMPVNLFLKEVLVCKGDAWVLLALSAPLTSSPIFSPFNVYFLLFFFFFPSSRDLLYGQTVAVITFSRMVAFHVAFRIDVCLRICGWPERRSDRKLSELPWRTGCLSLFSDGWKDHWFVSFEANLIESFHVD